MNDLMFQTILSEWRKNNNEETIRKLCSHYHRDFFRACATIVKYPENINSLFNENLPKELDDIEKNIKNDIKGMLIEIDSKHPGFYKIAMLHLFTLWLCLKTNAINKLQFPKDDVDSVLKYFNEKIASQKNASHNTYQCYLDDIGEPLIYELGYEMLEHAGNSHRKHFDDNLRVSIPISLVLSNSAITGTLVLTRLRTPGKRLLYPGASFLFTGYDNEFINAIKTARSIVDRHWKEKKQDISIRWHFLLDFRDDSNLDFYYHFEGPSLGCAFSLGLIKCLSV